jgi:hypothetical protein
MNRLKNSYSTCMSCGGKKMKSGGKWIQSAIKKPGSFTAQAKKAGMSVPAFRDKVLSNKGAYSSTTVKRANLAKTLAGMRKGEDGMEMDTLPKVKAIDPLNLAAKTTLNNLESTTVKGASPKVKAYQEMLRSKGYNIVADGAWGAETQKAYESYIKSKTMSSAPKAATTSSVKPAAKTTSTASSQTWNYSPSQWDAAQKENAMRPVAGSTYGPTRANMMIPKTAPAKAPINRAPIQPPGKPVAKKTTPDQMPAWAKKVIAQNAAKKTPSRAPIKLK